MACAAFPRPQAGRQANPLLGALADNGGPTLTMALGENSPAIDAGNDANAPPADQRGFQRTDGDGNGSVVSDIGAFEAAFVAVPSQVPALGAVELALLALGIAGAGVLVARRA